MVERAHIIAVDAKSGNKLTNPPSLDVQFNPASLKLSYSNNNRGGDQPGGTSKQYVGASSSKMQVELFFDTTASGTDVRAKTSHLSRFLQAPSGGTQGKDRPMPPRVQFSWGRVLFDGVIDSMDETLDFFSEEGVPLRATVNLSLSREGIIFTPEATSTSNKVPGAVPLTTAQGGDSVQSLASGGDWKSIATANGIDDPLRLSAGTFLNLQAGAGISAGAGLSVGASASAGFSAGLGGGVGLSAGASASAGAGVSAGGGIGGSIGGGVSASVSGGIGGSIGGGVAASVGVSTSLRGSATTASGIQGQASVTVNGGDW